MKLGGTAAVAIVDEVVSVVWYPSSGEAVEMVFAHALKLLRHLLLHDYGGRDG